MNFEPSSSYARLKKYYFWIIRLSLCSPISLVVRSRTKTQSTRNDNNALLLNRKGKKHTHNESDTKTVVSKWFGKAILKPNERENHWNYEENGNWSNAFASDYNNKKMNNLVKLFQYNHNNHLSRKWMKDEERVSLFFFSPFFACLRRRWRKMLAQRTMERHMEKDVRINLNPKWSKMSAADAN